MDESLKRQILENENFSPDQKLELLDRLELSEDSDDASTVLAAIILISLNFTTLVMVVRMIQFLWSN